MDGGRGQGAEVGELNAIVNARTPQQALAMALAFGRDALAASVPDPSSEARTLLALAAGTSRAGLIGLETEAYSETVLAAYMSLVEQRKLGRPMSHLRGSRAFYKHDFKVTPDVLDPRADTEVLIEAALQAPFARMLDLGTGSGCIALSLLAENAGARATASDISQAALDVARDNAQQMGLLDRVELIRSDWFEHVQGRYDLIVSNPPYISAEAFSGLERGVRDFEPRIALTDEADGLSAYRLICAQAGRYLEPGGRLLVEIGYDQGAAVMALFQQAGFSETCCARDIEGRDRVIGGKWPARGT